MLLSKRLVSGTVGSKYVLQDIVGLLLYQLVGTLKRGREGGREGGRKGRGVEVGRRGVRGNDAADGNFCTQFLSRGTLHISMLVSIQVPTSSRGETKSNSSFRDCVERWGTNV